MTSSTLTELGDALRVVWELTKRRPFLIVLPILLIFRFVFPEELEKWVAEAKEAIR